MFLSSLKRYQSRNVIVMVTMIVLLAAGLGSLPQAHAGTTGSGNTLSGGQSQKLCNPNVCFPARAGQDPAAAKADYAAKNNCSFIEDICSQGSPTDDYKGATGDDSAVFGDKLWPEVKDSLRYGYEFIKGLVAALGNQVSDLFGGVKDPAELAKGLIALGNAYYNDPQGTLASLGGMLGQESVAQTNRASQCGAYGQGQAIGNYVNPGFATKFVQTLTQYGGNVDTAVAVTNKAYGCASFAAGTKVLTSDGLRDIETINVGDRVFSRNELSYADKAQSVTNTFTRIAPSYRNLSTERGSFKVTDEHPIWVQGKGWTIASKLMVGDVIANEQGDSLVTGNDAVKEPLRVYNMSIANTSNYFVGSGGLWAHNSDCLGLVSKPWDQLTAKQKGFVAEYAIYMDMQQAGYKPVGTSFNPNGQTPDEAYKGWNGQTGIDGLYKGPNGDYIIVESKATGSDDPGNPTNKTAGLTKTVDGNRQMSDNWISKRLDKMVDPTKPGSQTDIDNIKAWLAAKPGSTIVVKKVYAQTNKDGTGYYEMNDPQGDASEVKVGNAWPLPTPP